MKSPRRTPCIAMLAALLLLASCTEETAVSSAGSADAAAIGTDVIGADGAANPNDPTVQGPGHGAGGYAEISGQWDAKSQRLKVAVWVGSIKDLLGIAAHLRYDPKALQLTKLELQSIAEMGDAGPGVWQSRGIAKDGPPGRILLGSARFRTAIAPFLFPEGAAVEREKWVALEFAVLTTGETKLRFDPPSQLARSGEGTALQLQWLDATVKVPQTFAVSSVGGVP